MPPGAVMASPDTLAALGVALGEGMPWLVRLLRERVFELDGENQGLLSVNDALLARMRQLDHLARTLNTEVEELREAHEMLADMVRAVVLNVRAGRFVQDDDFQDLAYWVGTEGPMLRPRDVDMDALLSDESDEDDDSDTSGMYD